MQVGASRNIKRRECVKTCFFGDFTGTLCPSPRHFGYVDCTQLFVGVVLFCSLVSMFLVIVLYCSCQRHFCWNRFVMIDFCMVMKHVTSLTKSSCACKERLSPTQKAQHANYKTTKHKDHINETIFALCPRQGSSKHNLLQCGHQRM